MEYRIREIREKRHISQETLAKLSGVSRSIISGLEQGTTRTTTVSTLLKLSEALGVSINDIFTPKSFNTVNESEGR